MGVQAPELAEQGSSNRVAGEEGCGEGVKGSCALFAKPISIRNGTEGGFGTEEVEGGRAPITTEEVSSVSAIIA